MLRDTKASHRRLSEYVSFVFLLIAFSAQGEHAPKTPTKPMAPMPLRQPAPPAKPGLCDDLEKKNADQIKGNHFNTTRTLNDYERTFGNEFAQKLKHLGESSHWVDGGSGESLAIQDYAKKNKGRATGVSYVFHGFDPKAKGPGLKENTHLSEKDRLRILANRFYEDIPEEEMKKEPYGRADVITDLYGVFAYTTRVDQTLEKYLSLVKDEKEGGVVYLYYGSHRGKTCVSGDVCDSIVINEKGEKLSLEEYIQTIKGIEARVIETRRLPSPYIQRTIRIVKKPGETVKVPKLKQECADDGTPPKRIFRVVAPVITSAEGAR